MFGLSMQTLSIILIAVAVLAQLPRLLPLIPAVWAKLPSFPAWGGKDAASLPVTRGIVVDCFDEILQKLARENADPELVKVFRESGWQAIGSMGAKRGD